jgi:uncharacterized membrane protein
MRLVSGILTIGFALVASILVPRFFHGWNIIILIIGVLFGSLGISQARAKT